MKGLRSRDGSKGRVARLGIDIGSGGVGGEGRALGGSRARRDRYESAVSKSGEMPVETEGGLEDLRDWALSWSTSGEGSAWGLVREISAGVRVDFTDGWEKRLGLTGVLE